MKHSTGPANSFDFRVQGEVIGIEEMDLALRSLLFTLQPRRFVASFL
jgi:hypothetical protein